MLKQNPTANRASGHRCRKAVGALCILLLTFGSGAGMADSERDHDRARQALEAGEVLPLRTILERVERQHPGQVIDVELEREHEDKGSPERWVYKIKLLRSGGALAKLKVDARTGAIIGKRERSGPEHEREQLDQPRSGSVGGGS
ncbi:MAG: PepSY domain-containing protein [Candidatus Accumulibacter sp.]|nr:PepSY domain-containing protein [Accumulibacter sp.]